MNADDPFDRLGLPPRFDLDPAAIDAAMMSRAAEIHPDLMANDPERLAEAQRRMAALNEARSVLADPEQRASVLLLRRGGPSAADVKDLPEGFLAEMLETRMEIEEAVESGDPIERHRWVQWACDRRAELLGEIEDALAGLGDPPDAAVMRAIRVRLNVLRYIERLVEQLPDSSGPAAPPK